MFRFTIRDVLLVTVTVGLAAGWWVDHQIQKRERIELAELLSDRETMLDLIVPGWRLPAANRRLRGERFQ